MTEGGGDGVYWMTSKKKSKSREKLDKEWERQRQKSDKGRRNKFIRKYLSKYINFNDYILLPIYEYDSL